MTPRPGHRARLFVFVLSACAAGVVHAGIEPVGPKVILGNDAVGVPLVAGRGEHGFVTVWNVPPSAPPAVGTRSRVRLFDLRGVPLGLAFEINPESADSIDAMFVSGNGQGRFLVGGSLTTASRAQSTVPEVHFFSESIDHQMFQYLGACDDGHATIIP